MQTVPDNLRQLLQAHGQEHTLAGWEQFDAAARTNLVKHLEAIDFDLLHRLYEERDHPLAGIAPDCIEAIPVIPSPSPEDATARSQGEEAVRRGQVAALVVAGGQGS